MRLLFLNVFLMAMACCALRAAEGVAFNFQSGTRQTSLLELYTSEGCSSCPPAEARLSHLLDDSRLWKEFVPVAFHVNYWDSLGWKDPWASGEFADRQRAYAAAWKQDTVYTPEFVLNGVEWKIGLMTKSVPRTGVTTGELSASSTNGVNWLIEFSPSQTAPGWEAHVALLGCGLSADVKAGENRGRNLKHDFVVIKLISLKLTSEGKNFRGLVGVDRRLQPARFRQALAVWVTRGGEMIPKQAVGGWLSTE